ncbi:unnamed protein product [Medioppia subpectinata]|uniref:XK-related protein n=1 Tax=Medioppia subpectinata TaxID=1979941 RepID=A0A7R9KLC6_9ACAR|nr:unnamed protein product [Medioppia subpectinata]CAG2104387.1 unnamed protein product [Medioppia subpectinata]
MVTEITLGSNSPISMDEMPVRNRQSPDNNSLNETTSSDTSATIASTSSPPQAPASQPTDRLIIAESVNTTDRYERRDLMDVLLVERMRVTNTDFGLFLLSIVLYLWDVASDIVLAINHYLNQNYWYFGLTLTFILLPSLVLMVIMRRWYNYLYEYQPPGNQPPTLPIQPTTACERHTLTACLWLQLGPMYRRIDILVHAHKSRQLTRSWEDRAEQFKCYSYKKRELNRSQIIETFMEAAPQLVLQLYIVAMSSTRNIGVLTWARVLAISLFASVFPIHLAVVCCLHYLAMFVWTVYVMGDIDGKNRASRIASAPPETTPDWPPINWPDIPEPIGESQSVPAPRGDQENPDDYRDRIIQSARKRFYKELRNSAGRADDMQSGIRQSSGSGYLVTIVTASDPTAIHHIEGRLFQIIGPTDGRKRVYEYRRRVKGVDRTKL